MHIHIDPVGGVAGDMFVAALLDAWPELTAAALAAVRAAGLDESVALALDPHHDGVLTGSRFRVSKTETGDNDNDNHRRLHRHDHTHWAALRRTLLESSLSDDIKKHAIGIFGELARAEAKIHGRDAETVVFHEVGNWDSVADIVAAASLIDALKAQSWSVGSLPLGSGRVKTAHGELPVPAPATSLLLDGFSFHDDGRAGERVTPTGAAILRYLSPSRGIGTASRALARTGYGFGTRKLEGMSNILRVQAFEPLSLHTSLPENDTVAVIEFDIDDQTGEELAVALERIRATQGVIDAVQTMAIGKKGRMVASVRVLARPSTLDAAVLACLRQTTTLGLRTRLENRTVLARRETTNEDGLRIKIARRPGGDTAKADIDAIAGKYEDQRERALRKSAAERSALDGTHKEESR